METEPNAKISRSFPSTMFFLLEDNPLQQYRPRLQKCGNFCTLVTITVAFVTLLSLLAIFAVDMTQRIHIVYIDGLHPTHVTNEKFLSIALDSSIIASGFKHFDFNDPKLIKLMQALSPAYLRIGGTMADRLTFSISGSMHFKNINGETDGGECSYESKYCDYLEKPNFTMNGQEWLHLNQLADKTGLEIIFDLNALKRYENGSWNYANAERLIHFSNFYNLNLSWELGNEPNSFRHQFNYDVTPEQLAKDFQVLRNVLMKYPKYSKSQLVGPDVTRPQKNNGSLKYLQGFLASGGSDVIDAVTWHQYYFNGAAATVVDFLNPNNFEILQWQISTIKAIVQRETINKPIWLGETSSAYGGGAPHLSNRYIASFLWLDKLGLAAKNGLDVVIRQSIFQGNYALITNRYYPTPDWWVSVLYKKLVGRKVVNCNYPYSEKLRLYCQCAQPERYYDGTPSVTVFGVNLGNRKVKIRFEGITPFRDPEAMKNLKVDAYILTTVERIDSRFIFLNRELLRLTDTNDVPKLLPETVIANPYVEMPAYSLGFWVVPITGGVPPYC